MKQGKTLTDLAAELERQVDAKEDYVADTRTLSMDSNGTSTLSMLDIGGFDVNGVAHRQIATRLGIPVRYYERLRTEVPDLLDENVNTLFRVKPEKRMVRTLDGTARAFLSDRYRRIDNYDIANVVLPILGNMPGAQVESAELTDTRMYLKFILTHTEAEVGVGDIVKAGIVISNSEVGFGAVKVEPLIWRLVCTNGMIVADRGMKKYHVGRQIEAQVEAAQVVFRDETVKADDKAFMLKVEDIVRAAADETLFQAIVDDLRELGDKKIEGNPVASIQTLAKKEKLSDKEQGNVLRHLVEGGDLSQWGVVNAVTRASQDQVDYDRCTELERLGGKIAMYSPQEAKEILNAG